MSNRVDSTSAVLAGTAVLTAIYALVKRTPKAQIASSVAVLAWIGYDRSHDGLWPFTNRRKQIKGGY